MPLLITIFVKKYSFICWLTLYSEKKRVSIPINISKGSISFKEEFFVIQIHIKEIIVLKLPAKTKEDKTYFLPFRGTKYIIPEFNPNIAKHKTMVIKERLYVYTPRVSAPYILVTIRGKIRFIKSAIKLPINDSNNFFFIFIKDLANYN